MDAERPGKTVVVFGDPSGIPQVVEALPCAPALLVGAAIRPEQHRALTELAAQLQVPFVVQPRRADAEHPAFVRHLADLDVDVIIVNSYSMLLTRDILATARGAAVNVHGGLLPRYRGPNPLQWAILAGETVAGVTMHHMSERFDEGPIIATRATPIQHYETWLDVHERLQVLTRELLADQLPRVLSGTAQAVPQDAAAAGHHRRRRPEDGEFTWVDPLLRIYNTIRALVPPLPPAFVVDRGVHHVFDAWLPIGQLAAVKHRALPAARPTAGGLVLSAEGAPHAGDPATRNSQITFRLGRETRVAVRLDWDRQVGLIPDGTAPAARDLLATFLGQELPGWGVLAEGSAPEGHR